MNGTHSRGSDLNICSSIVFRHLKENLGAVTCSYDFMVFGLIKNATSRRMEFFSFVKMNGYANQNECRAAANLLSLQFLCQFP